MTDLVLGIDIGTSSVKAGLYGFDGQARAVAESKLHLDRAVDGAVTQDMDGFFAATATATRQALAESGAKPGEVAAMAVDGQMAGVGLVDRDNRPVAPYDSWLDVRCGTVVEQLSPSQRQRILLGSGLAPTVSIGPKMVWWARHRPEAVAQAAKFVTAGGYVIAQAAGLPGPEAFIDPTYLHFAALTNNVAKRWDLDLVEELGLPVRLLPQVVASTELVGRLTRAAAEQFGLVPGLPIAAGCGDTAAAAVGAGATLPGQALDVAGTAGVLAVHRPSFTPDPTGTLMMMRSPLGEDCYALAYVGGAGELVEWACTALLGHSSPDAAAYADLAATVNTVPPGAEGLVAWPHFSGRICPASPRMRGAFLGFSPRHTRAHMVRAVLEAVALEYRSYALAASQLAGEAASCGVTQVLGTGGGSKLAVWNQIKADVLGVTYWPLRGVDVGTRGAAMVAMAGLGLTPPPLGRSDLDEPFRPHQTLAATYGAAYRRFTAWEAPLANGFDNRQEQG